MFNFPLYPCYMNLHKILYSPPFSKWKFFLKRKALQVCLPVCCISPVREHFAHLDSSLFTVVGFWPLNRRVNHLQSHPKGHHNLIAF